MPGTLPPYALDVTSFRFPALAALAGRAPLGGAREAALAALLVARLAADALLTAAEPVARAERAGLARQWLSGVTLPPAARTALGRAVDATGQPSPGASVRPMLEGAAAALSPLLDPPSRAELQQLARALGE